MSFFLSSWRPYAWIALAGLAVYSRVFSFGYVYLDDNALILGNYHFLSRWSSLIEVFRQDVFHIAHGPSAYYRPLFMASLVFDAHWAGLSAGGYHFTNLLIHVAASSLLFLFFKRLGYAAASSLFFSLAFTVSPVLTQAVALIPDRDDPLMGLFALAAFVFFLDYIETGSRKKYLGHLLLFAAALFSKETAVVLAPVSLIYLRLVAGQRLFSPAAKALAPGWAAVAAVWFFMRRAALERPLPLPLSDMAHSIAANFPAAVQFCGKILLPFNLAVLPLQGDTTVLYGIAALALVAAALALSPRKRWGYIGFGLAWFGLFLLPSMTLHYTSFADVMMEKRIYVPMVGFLIIFLETSFAERLASGEKTAWRAGAALLAGYAAVTFWYSGKYKDRMVFWKSAVASSPHLPLAHRNLGAMHYLDGDLAKAAAAFRAAARLNPVEPMVHNNLGLILMREGKLQEAEIEYKKELAINPRYDNALFNLGLLYYHQGRPQRAEALWRRVIETNPDYADAYYNLIVLSLARRDAALAGRYAQALRSRGLPIPPRISQALGRSE